MGGGVKMTNAAGEGGGEYAAWLWISPREDRCLSVDAAEALVRAVALLWPMNDDFPPAGEKNAVCAIHPPVRSGGCPVAAVSTGKWHWRPRVVSNVVIDV